MSNGFEKISYQNTSFNNGVFAVYFRKTFYRLISVRVLT